MNRTVSMNLSFPKGDVRLDQTAGGDSQYAMIVGGETRNFSESELLDFSKALEDFVNMTHAMKEGR